MEICPLSAKGKISTQLTFSEMTPVSRAIIFRTSVDTLAGFVYRYVVSILGFGA